VNTTNGRRAIDTRTLHAMTTPRGPAVAILTRRPEAGVSKTRLAAAIGEEAAAALARAMLLDVAGIVRTAELWHPALAVEPPEAARDLAELTGIGDARTQVPGDIGVRMLGVALELEREGYGPLILVGSDLPLLSTGLIHHALRALRRADIVFSPAADGSYSLIGMRRAYPAVLDTDEVTWSGPRVLKDSLRLAEAAGLSHGTIAPLDDIDTVEDLDTLRAEIERRQAAGEAIPAHTLEALTALDA
jgi:rSAM/selenodomain-associated transferase 1